MFAIASERIGVEQQKVRAFPDGHRAERIRRVKKARRVDRRRLQRLERRQPGPDEQLQLVVNRKARIDERRAALFRPRENHHARVLHVADRPLDPPQPLGADRTRIGDVGLWRVRERLPRVAYQLRDVAIARIAQAARIVFVCPRLEQHERRNLRRVITYESEYDVVPELRAGGERHESLRYGARIEIALRSFLEDGGFSAFTTNFEDLGGLRQLPGLAVQRLMADGYGFGGEGDWKTSALVAILKAMAGDAPGGTSFMEDYTYHFGPGTPLVLGAHMLEVCPTIAGDKPRIEIHPLGIGGREDPVRLVFRGKPGPGFVVGLLDLGERFRLVANDIEVVPPLEELPKLPVACAVWEPAPSLATSAECWLSAGGPHHTAMTTAVPYEALADLALMLDVELAHIDAATTVQAFTQELRWNNAYYRLAQGL